MFKFIIAVSLIASTVIHAEIKVLALSGSLREDSVNRKLVLEAANIARQQGADVTVVNLKDYAIPFYDADLETQQKMPEGVKKLRQQMLQSQVIFIASPEYNGSLTGLLKNAIDWASRSETGSPSREAFQGKKFLLLSASPGPGGGARGLVHLKAILENLGGIVLPTQVVLPKAYNAFNAQGHLTNENAKAELKKAVLQAL